MHFFLTLAFISFAMLCYGQQKKVDSVRSRILQKSKAWNSTERSYDAMKHRYYNSLADQEVSNTTGVILDGKKLITNGLGIIKSIPASHMKKLEIYRDTATIRKYFTDSTVKVVLIIDTKQ